MRKVFHLTLIAAATLSLAACQKEIESSVATTKGNEIQLNFSSVKPNLTDVETKTAWTGETITWSKGDAIRIAYTVNDTWQAAAGAPESGKPAKMYASDALTEDAEIASFKVSTYFTDEANQGQSNLVYKFYGIYPKDAGATDFTNAPSLNIAIPAEQTPKANSFDGALDIMYATSADYDGIPNDRNVDLNWHRIVSHADISMRNLQFEAGETLQSITVTAQSGADLVGSHTLNITNGEVTLASGATAGNSVTVKADNLTLSSGAVEFWFTSLPFTASELTFTVRTDKYSYIRSFTGLNLQFLGNARNTLSVNMKKAIKLVNYEESFSEGVGDFTADEAWSHGTYNGTSYMKAQSTDAANGAWLVSPKLSILTNQSTLSFSQSINKYFGTIENEATVWAREVGGEWTKINITYPDKPSSGWSSFEETTASLSAYEGKTIQIGFKYVGTTESYGGWEISNFKVTNASAIYDPVFTITSATTQEVSFNASTVEFTYSASHLTSDPTVAIKAGSDDIIDGTPTIADGVITVNVKANNDEVAKTATLVVSCEGVTGIPELVINQDAKAGDVFAYSFTSKSWEAKRDDIVENWTSGQDGAGFSNSGIQVTKNATGANGTSPFTFTDISEIVLTYCTNASDGAGTISIQVGDNTPNSVTVSKTGGTKARTLSIKYATRESGKVKITVNCTSNSIYLIGASITAASINLPTAYAITCVSGLENGSVEADAETAYEGTTVNLTATPATGYRLDSWNVYKTGDETTKVTVTGNSFTMPAYPVTVSASFVPDAGEPAEPQEVTIKYTGTTTTNMTGNNDAATVGLDPSAWSVVGAKGASTNFPGLNKAGDIRLYYADDGSNTITVTALKTGVVINSIVITYTGAGYNNGKVLVGGEEVTISSGSYPINSQSFVITNGNTSNVQVRISKVDITYTPAE